VKHLFILLLFALAAYGQQKEKVAIINTVDDGSPQIPNSELSYLTKKLRGIAVNALPQNNYDIMTDDYIIDISGSQDDADKKCEEAGGCLAKLGREIKVHYITQARIGRFGKDLTIATELYDTRSSKLLGSLEGEAKDIHGLLSELEKKAPDMFKKMLPQQSAPQPQTQPQYQTSPVSVTEEKQTEPSFNANLRLGSCTSETNKAKTLYEKCKKIGKNSAEYTKCADDYKNQKARAEKACRASNVSNAGDLETSVKKWEDQSNSRGCRSSGRKKDANCATILQQWGQKLYELEEYEFTEEQNEFKELVQWCADRDNDVKKYPKCSQTSAPPKVNHDGSMSIFESYINAYPDGSSAEKFRQLLKKYGKQ